MLGLILCEKRASQVVWGVAGRVVWTNRPMIGGLTMVRMEVDGVLRLKKM